MNGPSLKSSSEIELVGQLKRLLVEEQRWLAHEGTGRSPFLDRRAVILEALSNAARARAAGSVTALQVDMDELRRQILALSAIHQRSIEMVRTRMKGIEWARERLESDRHRDHSGPVLAHIGRG